MQDQEQFSKTNATAKIELKKRGKVASDSYTRKVIISSRQPRIEVHRTG